MKDGTNLQPGILPKERRLSVCMIVRDEEKMLPRCLKSVRDVADELIIVDTGSKDNTISIARDFGAKVYHFKWCDDFAAARNESLKHATGDWILQMDADEELSRGSVPLLNKAILNPFCLLCVITLDNGVGCLSVRFWKVGRLFRNHPKVRYSRPYHETVDMSICQLTRSEPGWQVLNHPEIRIHHYGYEFSEMQRVEKFSRALRVMEAYIERNPHDAYILTKLGETCSYLKRYEDAERYFKKAMEIDPDWIDSPSAHMHLGIVYTRKGMLDEAIAEYKKALITNRDYAKAHYNLSIAYYKKGNYSKAIEHSDKALGLGFEVHPEFLALLRPYRGRMQQAG